MKLQSLILIIAVLTSSSVFGQKVKTPKTMEEAIQMLYQDCPDSLQATIKQTSDNNLINLCYPWDGNYKTIFNWVNNDNRKSKIRKHLIKQGISDRSHQQTVILIAFKNSLLGQKINEAEIFKPYQKIEKKWATEDQKRFINDSLRGIYIPKDLDDCFKQIDSFWDDSTKTMVKNWSEEEFSANAHFGFGRWMRNNWQLWGGSRLSKYFNEMGIYHPDGMSGIILDSYHRYLLGKEIKLDEQIKHY